MVKWLFCLYCVQVSILRAQSGELFPFQYDQYYACTHQWNPANNDTSVVSISLSNRSYTGLFTGVNRSYIDAAVRISRHSPFRMSYAGVMLSNNQEGEYIKRLRAYGRYSWVSKIRDKIWLSLGLSAGIVQYSFQSSQAGPGGSDTHLDVAVGIICSSNRWKMGVSVLQLSQPEMQPLSTTYFLNRYGVVLAEYSFWNGLNWKGLGSGIVQFNNRGDKSIQFNTRFKYRSLVEFGVMGFAAYGFGPIIGFPELKWNERYIFHFGASYLLSTRQLASNRDDVVELFLQVKW